MKTFDELAADELLQKAEQYRRDRIIQANRDYIDGFNHGFLAGYQAAVNSLNNSNSSDDPDLQEQLEALQQYMTVAQRKIMGLEGQVESLRCDLRVLVSVIELMRRGL